MSGGASGRPTLLFVLSNDYGELFDAVCFLEGLDCEARFLLPSKLFDRNRETFAHRAVRYETPQDLRAAVDDADPDLILLCSAYLFAINDILEMPALAGLLGEWRTQGRLDYGRHVQPPASAARAAEGALHQAVGAAPGRGARLSRAAAGEPARLAQLLQLPDRPGGG